MKVGGNYLKVVSGILFTSAWILGKNLYGVYQVVVLCKLVDVQEWNVCTGFFIVVEG